MKFHKTELTWVYLIELPKYEDNRWKFIRTFNDTVFETEIWYKPVFEETYYSHSVKNVIRGMHFQTAPYAQDKFVYVIQWEILDVILDVNKESPTYWKHISVQLSSENNMAVFISKGYAHGFASISEESITAYMVSSWYAPKNDKAIHWNSFGFDWNIQNPIVSERDNIHPHFWEAHNFKF